MVCPTNELCKDHQSNGIISIIFNNLFNVGLNEEMHINKFDDSQFDVIVFDEVFLLGINMLTRIKIMFHPIQIKLYYQQVIQCKMTQLKH